MGKLHKLHQKILAEEIDANIEFRALCNLLLRLGFDLRIKGSHHVFARSDIAEIISLQPNGNKAKVYQVRQIRGLFLKYRIGVQDDS